MYVDKITFSVLEKFILENKQENTEFLKLSVRKNYGKVLQAQQYVGVLQTKEGTTLEILPKITDVQNTKSKEENKKLFLQMLKYLKNSPFKNINTASLKTQKNFPLLEIFITLFCDEISHLIQKGLRSEYLQKEENSFFLKGKLLFQKHISKNLIHPEKFFVQYDVFSSNRSENKLLKSTIHLLLKKSKSAKNIARLREYFFVFDEISFSKNFDHDFSKIKISRDMNLYKYPLQWAEIFLQKKHITPILGNSLASALLFDMNKIFEDYVASCLKKSEKYKSVKTQVSQKSLIEYPQKKFLLKPDLILEKFSSETSVKKIIADTKWKKISQFGDISQADMYQMFAYAKKYEIDTIQLLYPYHKNFPENSEKLYFEKNISLEIVAFDIQNQKLLEREK